MSRSIDTAVAKIRSAVYGKDVREAIAKSVEETYDACDAFRKQAAASAAEAAKALPLDSTLSASGKAADAEAVRMALETRLPAKETITAAQIDLLFL